MNHLTPSARPARIPLTLETKLLMLLALGGVILLGALLYPFPTETRLLWMWEMADPRSAILLGSLYFAASVYYIGALRVNDWTEGQAGLLGIFIVASFLLAPVALHWEVVRPYHPTTLLWLFGYYAPLFLVPIFWRLQT